MVLPPDEPSVVKLRPVDGSDTDAVGIYTPLEPEAITSSQYPPPDPAQTGDFTGALLLRDAVRLSLRNTAGPFRSMGRLSVTPRPYQFVPLIMSLGLNPVRLLLADDVGVGKTIEASMIARELLDRGTIRRIGVLCPPHLCEQWGEELRTKFNIDATLVQSSRVARLERALPRGDISLYQYYRHLVVSIDFVKSDRNRRLFLDNAPDFIIVDEAHASARPRGRQNSNQHQRYALIKDLAKDPNRHIILATATPHSGIEESFRSLLGILDQSLDLPEETNIPRSQLLPHVVQRKRADLQRWLGTETPFPERKSSDHSYQMSPDYHRLYEDILGYCREYVSDKNLTGRHQRVRYWAALSILRCVLSSPLAARGALENRRPSPASETDEDIPEDILSQQIMDAAEEEQATDYISAAPLTEPGSGLTQSEIRRLDGFLRRADQLAGPDHDGKIRETIHLVSELLEEGHKPIVYCRFIQTAYYVAQHLQQGLQHRLPALQVKAVTGNEGDSEQRKELVVNLAKEPLRVLVATDCLSEGVNLQEHYDAVIHYDLPWNPNRLEQREGRVDRFGQSNPVVKTITLHGADNEVDLVVLDVLIRKARTIRERLGISVPVPAQSEQVVNALVNNILLRGASQGRQATLALEDDSVSQLHNAWDEVASKENQTRTFFAQSGINPDTVAHELAEMEPVMGSPEEIRRFLANALQRFEGELGPGRKAGTFRLQPGSLVSKITSRDPGLRFPMQVSFEGIPPSEVTLLGRNHPVVTTASEAVLGQALESSDSRFPRAGAFFTQEVTQRTAVLILRLRYLIQADAPQFAEEVVAAAFQTKEDALHWQSPLQGEALRLLQHTEIAANMPAPERATHVRWALEKLQAGWAEPILKDRVSALQDAHERLTKAAKLTAVSVTAHDPPDIIGCYVLVPAGV